ncbi:hypothetical protein P9A14_02505 [Gordonia hongkongensis]|uniref:Terminase small subunit n=1 Tax=Gordonia hongkongensis TaxID=1701090 RepID=A0AAX3T8F6_9ACTN|nr:hypothetical protein [Gordonia hongkongensis]QIK49652.1 hypothetical protein G8C36_22235 [Gordonia terrae]WFP25415.1 hypothetical protein P9A14_02505 [Gordonia hongkongensis]
MESPDHAPVPLVDTKPASGTPARGYSWEQFKPNHTKSLKHGAYSERMIAPLAAEIANELLETYPRLRGFREAVLEYARIDAQVERLQAHVDEHGELGEDGDPTGAAKLLLRTRVHLANRADSLGLTPLANARLGKDNAAAQFDLAKLFAEMAKQDQRDT